MTDVQALHNRAMELAEEAAYEQAQGNTDRARSLSAAALDKERQAAELLLTQFDMEPTRSVLFRSAASLALDCQDHRSAEKLIAHGLSGEPPAEIAAELRDLLEQINFRRHLDLRGVTLAAREFQMSLSGDAVGFGLADTEAFVGRVQDLEKLIYRTAERQSRRPFRDRGRRGQRLAKDVEVYLSVPRAASFAVTIRIGYPSQMTFPGMDIGESVVEDLLDCMEAVGSGRQEALEQKIPDLAYRRNFLALARRIAPDGEAIRSVGFTAVAADRERRVLLTRLQSEISTPEMPEGSSLKGKRVTVLGTLKFADSTREDRDEIKLVDAEGRKHRILVPEGMMDDIVRPLWDYKVKVTGTLRGQVVFLRDITKAAERQDID